MKRYVGVSLAVLVFAVLQAQAASKALPDDVDGDGQVTLSEYLVSVSQRVATQGIAFDKAKVERNFKLTDTDKNGVITAEEQAAFNAAKAASKAARATGAAGAN